MTRPLRQPKVLVAAMPDGIVDLPVNPAPYDRLPPAEHARVAVPMDAAEAVTRQCRRGHEPRMPEPSSDPATTPVSALMTRAPRTCTPYTPAHEAARTVAEAKVCSPCVRTGDEPVGVRRRHHANRVVAGDAPDNPALPSTPSARERETLRDAFAVVRTLHSAVAQARGTLL